MKRIKVVYIAGPYRDNRGEYHVRQNIRHAEAAAIHVWQNGGVALCPHKNTAGFGGVPGCTDKTWLEGDLELLFRSDAMWAIEGWRNSAGAIAEVEFARQLNIPVLFCLNEVKGFLRKAHERI